MAMARLKLEIEYDYEFFLLGISSHAKDYRLCWAINNALTIDMRQDKELLISLRKDEAPSAFSLYFYNDVDNFKYYFLVSNKSSSGILIPELKQMDYFLLIRNNLNPDEKQKIATTVKNINLVLATLQIDPGGLKSKQNLIF